MTCVHGPAARRATSPCHQSSAVRSPGRGRWRRGAPYPAAPHTMAMSSSRVSVAVWGATENGWGRDDPALATAHRARPAHLRDHTPPEPRGGHLLARDRRAPAALVHGLLAQSTPDDPAVHQPRLSYRPSTPGRLS